MLSRGRFLCIEPCASHRWSRCRLSPAWRRAARPPPRSRLRQPSEESHDVRPRFYLWFASRCPFLFPRRSPRQRECLGVDVDEDAPEGADMTVEVGGLRALKIRKETPDPRRHMFLEQAALGVVRRLKAAAD